MPEISNESAIARMPWGIIAEETISIQHADLYLFSHVFSSFLFNLEKISKVTLIPVP